MTAPKDETPEQVAEAVCYQFFDANHKPGVEAVAAALRAAERRGMERAAKEVDFDAREAMMECDPSSGITQGLCRLRDRIRAEAAKL